MLYNLALSSFSISSLSSPFPLPPLLNKGIPAWDPALNGGKGGLHAEKVEECRSASIALAHCLEHDIKVRREEEGGGEMPCVWCCVGLHDAVWGS